MEVVQKNGKPNLEEELMAPYRQLLKTHKNNIASDIYWCFNHWFNVPEDVFLRIAESMTLFVNGLTMIDDIQDNSLMRYGLPSAQSVYGVPLALNTGIQVVAESMKIIVDLTPDGSAAKLYAEHFHEIMIGQGSEIYWRDNFICPTEEQYKKMHHQKTGAYIKLGVKLLQSVSDNKIDVDHLLDVIGLYCQLDNDYSNLCAKELNPKGTFCEDITEGKFTLPIIHASKTPAAEEIFDILRKRTSDVELKKHCLSLLEKTGSLQYTRDRLRQLDRETRAEMARLGGNPQLEAMLKKLSSWKENTISL